MSIATSSSAVRVPIRCRCSCQSVTSNHHGSSGSDGTSYSNDDIDMNMNMNHEKNKVYCHQCIQHLLSSKILAHRQALEERNRKRAWCAAQLTQMRMHANNKNDDTTTIIPNGMETETHNNNNDEEPSSASPTLEQYQDRIAQLTQKLNETMKECGSKSVALATISVQTSVRAEALDDQKAIIDHARRNLDALSYALIMGTRTTIDSEASDGDDNGNVVVDGNDENCQNESKEQSTGASEEEESLETTLGVGSLSSTIHMHVAAVKRSRFQLALQAFEMHKMDVGTEYQSLTLQDLCSVDDNQSSKNASGTGTHGNARFRRLVNERVPSGIGKIFGLLLPHRGPSHFNGVLPTNILTSSLRLVASLVNVLARCLSIELPHPIVLRAATSSSSMGTSTGSSSSSSSSMSRGGTAAYAYPRSRTNALTRITRQYEHERSEDCWVEQAADIIQSVACSSEVRDDEFGPKLPPNEERHNLTLMKDLDELNLGNDDGGGGNHDEGDDNVITNANNNERNIKGSNEMESATSTRSSASTSARHTIENDHYAKYNNDLSNSTSSVLSLMGSSSNLLKSTALKAFGKMTGHKVTSSYDATTTTTAAAAADMSIRPPPMDDFSISERLKHANYAVLFESNVRTNTNPRSSMNANTNVLDKGSRNGRYILKPPSSSSRLDRDMKQKEEEHFTIGLQLLQNDIIALCIKAGVPVNILWPAEAMLLNLNSLRLYCESQIEST